MQDGAKHFFSYILPYVYNIDGCAMIKICPHSSTSNEWSYETCTGVGIVSLVSLYPQLDLANL